MKFRLIHTTFVVVLLLASSTQAAVVTVDVTIKTVNPQARGITVVYKTELGEKIIELDVSRKAEITLNGKDATLDSLGTGLKGKVSFDRDLAIVTKIEAKGTVTVTKQPELVQLSELNDEGTNDRPWPSEDGLTIYWVRSTGTGDASRTSIWTARRENLQEPFTDKKSLFSGGCPSVTADGLEMILQQPKTDGQEGSVVCVAERQSLDKPFGRPIEIAELLKHQAGAPAISADGVTLYLMFNPSGDPEQAMVAYSTRKSRSSPWGNPKTLPNIVYGRRPVGGPCVTEDGLNLLCYMRDMSRIGTGSLLIWSRSADNKPFEGCTLIEFDNLPPLQGKFPRYVAATNELYFGRIFIKNKKMDPGRQGIWVVKNFTPPK